MDAARERRTLNRQRVVWVVAAFPPELGYVAADRYPFVERGAVGVAELVDPQAHAATNCAALERSEPISETHSAHQTPGRSVSTDASV